MEFALSEDQRLLQDSIDRFLADRLNPEALRACVEGDGSVGDDVAKGLGELGLPLALIPEDRGGLGLGCLEGALIQEMLGRHVAPVPFTAGSAMAVTALRAAGSDAQQGEWLGRIAAGEARFAVALSESAGARPDAGFVARDGRLAGAGRFVLELDGATHALVAAAEGTLWLVDLAADGVTRGALMTIDRTRGFGELTLDAVPAERLAGEGNADGLARTLAVGRVLLAADTLGAAQAMLDKAVAYAMEREQFGRAIASFQAVKHLCAEMAARLEPCRSLVWYAGHALDAVPDEAELMACLAKSHLAEVGQFVARTATEVHGGMGFTELLGLPYWFKRIGANRQLLGTPHAVREQAARLQGWG